MTQKLRSSSAKDLLNRYSHASLLQMAREKGLPSQGQSKPALVNALAKTLYDPKTIQAALADLEPVERELLDNLIVAGGEAPSAVLRQQLEAEGKIDRPPRSTYGAIAPSDKGTPVRRGSRRFADLVARLGALGLAHTANVGAYASKVELGIPGLYLFIPTAVMKHLPAVTLPVETAPAPPQQTAADPSLLLRDVYLFAGFARTQPIPLTVRGLIPKRNLVQIDESLRIHEGASRVASEAELGRLPFLRALEEEVGILVAGANGLSLGQEADGYFRLLPGEQRRALYHAYRATRRWSELSRLTNIAMTPRDSMTNPTVVAARQRVLDEVGTLPPGEWIPVSHLVDRVRRRAFDFLLSRVPRQNSYYYYDTSVYAERNPYYGDNAMGLSFSARDDAMAVGWETVEGQLIRVVVAEALAWLGMVDLGGVEGQEPSVFRITPDGALLLQGGTPESAERRPQVVIQPNFQIFAFEPTGEDVLFVLDSIAERVRAEQAIEYRLTRESVYAAQRQGMEAPEILRFLESVSTTPLPQNVRRSLEEWGAQHERIVVRRRTPVLHAVDEPTLDALYANADLQALLGRRLGPTVALIPPAHLRDVFTYLATRGPTQGLPLPALSEGDDTWRGGVVTVDRDGLITFGERLPSIHVKRALRRFTEEEDDGTLRLTAERLQQAASKDKSSRGGRPSAPLTADQMIATLERLQGGPLPEEVGALVRRWAKDWGKGALVDAALLQVESPAILADLVADEEFGAYLQPVPGAPTLAVVPRKNLEQVRRRLAERGMQLESHLLSG